MFATLLVVFREAIEAGLIVGIVLAASRGVPGRNLQVGLGVLAGVVGACLVAVFAGRLANAFDGAGQEIFNAVILGTAVLMLAWHVIWMARHGRQMAAEMRAVGKAVREGVRPVSALSVVVGVAVLREGSELVLFLYGIAIGGGGGAGAMLTGGAGGLTLAVLLTAFTYAGLIRLPAAALFAVTGWLVTFLAAGLAAQAAGFLQQGGVVDAMAATVWNSSALLSETSLGGRMLHTLIGYSDRPSELQLLVYLVTLLAITLAARFAAMPRPAPARSA